MATTLRVQSRTFIDALQIWSLGQVDVTFERVARNPRGIVVELAPVVQLAPKVLRSTNDACMSFSADQHRAILTATTGVQTKREYDDRMNRVIATRFSYRAITSQTSK